MILGFRPAGSMMASMGLWAREGAWSAWKTQLILVLALAVGASAVSAREKIDVITLTNGDRVTGEIKKLDVGVLTVSTDTMGTVFIEWIWVAAIQSEQLFEVEEEGGERFFGTLQKGDGAAELEVMGLAGRSYVLPFNHVVRISTMEKRWLDRWSGYIDLGAAFASANAQEDLTVNAEATYSGEEFRLKNTFAGSSNDREDAVKTSRLDLASSFRRTLAKRWFWYTGLQFSRNEELELELRSSASGGAGRYVYQSSRAQWALYGGLSGIKEDYLGEEEEGWSAEAVLASDYQLYLFEGRETSFAASLAVLPSLTVSGRFRVEFSSSFRRKLVRDFTVAFSLVESYDSKPPEEAESSDTRFQATLGWTF